MPASVLLVANGEPPSPSLLREQAEQASFVACTDGGVAAVLAAGLRPNLVLGDLDSITQEAVAALGCAEVLHLAEQATTDLEKALYTLVERGAELVTVLGAGGQRCDHFLSNLLLLACYADRLRLVALDDWGRLTLARPGEPVGLTCEVGDTVSLLPLPRATGVRTSGLRWQPDSVLDLAGAQSISNEVVGLPAHVVMDAGRLGVYELNRRHHHE